MKTQLAIYLWNYQKKYGEAIEELRTKYPDVIFCVFRNNKEMQSFLAGLQ